MEMNSTTIRDNLTKQAKECGVNLSTVNLDKDEDELFALFKIQNDYASKTQLRLLVQNAAARKKQKTETPDATAATAGSYGVELVELVELVDIAELDFCYDSVNECPIPVYPPKDPNPFICGSAWLEI